MSLMLALYRCGRAAEALRACCLVPATSRGRGRGRAVAGGARPRTPHPRRRRPPARPAGHRRRAASSRSGLTVRGYELREEIGRGAFGAVFRAYQPIVGREVAIKVIKPGLADDPAFIRRFEAEAQLVAGLEHPHIVPLYDYWREPGAAYLVMRLVDAGSLADVLAGGALPRRSRLDGVRPDRQRAAVRPPQRCRPRRREAGEHPHRWRRQRLPDGLRGRCRRRRVRRRRRPCRTPRPSSSPAGALSPASDHYSLAVIAAAALTGMCGEYEQVRGALAPARARCSTGPPPPIRLRRYPDVAAFGQALTDALGVTGSPLLDDPGSRTRTRVCGRSARPTPAISSGANASSNGSSPGSASPAPGDVSSPSSGRAGAASRAWCGPGCCRRWRRARCRCRRSGSAST